MTTESPLAAPVHHSGAPGTGTHHAGLGRRILANVITIVLASAASLYLAILVTPARSIQIFGQTLTIKAQRPTLSWSGPGTLEEFGHALPTVGINFPGFIRPVISFAGVTRSSANATALNELAAGQTPPGYSAADVQAAFLHGWTAYFLTVAADAVGILVLAVAVITAVGILWKKIRPGWFRWLRVALPVTVVVSLLILGSGVWMAATTGLRAVSRSTSLDQIFGVTSIGLPPAEATTDTTTQVAVIGDSVPAGQGLPTATDATEFDKLCQRSADAFPNALQTELGLQVKNLACSSATIPSGLFSSQERGGQPMPPQLSTLQSMKDLRLIVINVGADDIDWSHLVGLCYILPECSDNAVAGYFTSNLNTFSNSWRQLLSALQDIISGLDHQVAVVVNTYYDPLGERTGTDFSCPELVKPGIVGGLNLNKAQQMRAYLDQLNSVIAEGARASGFAVARVDFTGHELCSQTPYVQGMRDNAPLHPTVAGQLMIAGTVLAALPDDWTAIRNGLPSPGPSTEPTPPPPSSAG